MRLVWGRLLQNADPQFHNQTVSNFAIWKFVVKLQLPKSKKQGLAIILFSDSNIFPFGTRSDRLRIHDCVVCHRQIVFTVHSLQLKKMKYDTLSLIVSLPKCPFGQKRSFRQEKVICNEWKHNKFKMCWKKQIII